MIAKATDEIKNHPNGTRTGTKGLVGGCLRVLISGNVVII